MSFKVGDKVKVKECIFKLLDYSNNTDFFDNSVGWCPEMSEYIGKTLTIKEVYNISRYSFYRVEENRWNWIDEMLEFTTESKKDTNNVNTMQENTHSHINIFKQDFWCEICDCLIPLEENKQHYLQIGKYNIKLCKNCLKELQHKISVYMRNELEGE